MKSKLTILYITLTLTLVTNTASFGVAQEISEAKEPYNGISGIAEMKFDSSGNLVIAGDSEIGPMVVKYDSNGTLLWHQILNATGENHIVGMLIDRLDNIILLGKTNTNDFPVTARAFQDTYAEGEDFFMTMFDKNGILVWSTYIGGSGFEWFTSFELDANDNIVLIGGTESNNFPLVNAFDTFNNNTELDRSDMFILKMAPTGVPIFSTYFGGSGIENGLFKLLQDGSMIGMGLTSSTDFPTTTGAYQDVYGGGGQDIFFAKISANGQLLWSTYFGGSESEPVSWFNAIVDKEDNLIFTGSTNSSDIVTTHGSGFSGEADSIIVKVSPEGNIVFSTHFGGSGIENDFTPFGVNLLIDSENSIITSGFTTSNDLPVLNSIMDKPLVRNDPLISSRYIMKYDKTGNLIFATHFVRPTSVPGNILIDNQDNIVIIGTIDEQDQQTLPLVNEYKEGVFRGLDIFITKLDKTGQIIYSTYFGGFGIDVFVSSIINENDDLFVFGRTGSKNFPISGDEDFERLDSLSNTNSDLFVYKFDASGNLLWSRLLGGDKDEYSLTRGNFIMDENGNIFLGGLTQSTDLSSLYGEVELNEDTAFLVKLDSNGETQWTQYAVAPPLVKEEPKNELDYLLPLILGSIVLLGAVSYGFKTWTLSKNASSLLLNDKMESILSPVFIDKPKLLYLFAGQTLIKDKDLKNEIRAEVPIQMYDFKDLFHPIRMSLLKLLYDNTQMTTIELKDALGVKWDEVHYNVKFLKTKGYIQTEKAIVDEVIKTVVHANPNAMNLFQQMKDMLVDFLSSSPNMGKYLEHVLEIKNRSSHESDLYPDTTIDS